MATGGSRAGCPAPRCCAQWADNSVSVPTRSASSRPAIASAQVRASAMKLPASSAHGTSAEAEASSITFMAWACTGRRSG